MERRLLLIVLLSAMLLLVVFLAEGSRSESCQCFFTGPCEFDEDGIGYRYRLCRGSCAAYSSWAQYAGCYDTRSFERKIIY